MDCQTSNVEQCTEPAYFWSIDRRAALTRWSTTIVYLRMGYRMSPCEGVCSTISGHSSRSSRLWAGGDRTRIRHSCRPYIEARLPRGASGSGIQMKNDNAVRLTGCTLLVRWMSRLFRCLQSLFHLGICVRSSTMADRPYCQYRFVWLMVGDDVVLSVDLPSVIAPPGKMVRIKLG